MHRLLTLLLCCFIAATQFLQASTDERTRPIGELLEELDIAISHKKEYQERRLHLADSLRLAAASKRGYDRIELLKAMLFNYDNFQADSTFMVLSLIKQTPEFANDVELQNYVYLTETRAYGIKGLYSMAFERLYHLDTSGFGQNLLLQYHNTRYAVIGWFADFAAQYSPELSQQLTASLSPINDTLMALESVPLNRRIILANKLHIEGQYQSAVDSLELILEQTAPHLRTFLYSGLAQSYGKLGQREQEMRYLALTAIQDIRNGNTEYMALPILAQCAFLQGQTTRAYNYLICSLEDANFCKASLRTFEASSIFPIIDRAQKDEELRHNHFIKLVVIALSVLSLLLVLGLLQMWQQHRKLNRTRQLLAKANDDLKHSNLQLHAFNKELISADKVKEEYIMRYLSRCRRYLSSFASFQRQMYKLMQTRQLEELGRQLKSTAVISEEQEHFYHDFDEAFLNLYPNFIEKFNSLLKEEAQILPKKGELLTTELRIFALIRLGETDSAQIAKFLNYSLTTIYNYRSRVRNNAREDKENFEKQVMLI